MRIPHYLSPHSSSPNCFSGADKTTDLPSSFRRLVLPLILGLNFSISFSLAQKTVDTTNQPEAPTRYELDPKNPNYQVVERGPHHDVLQRVIQVVNAYGETEERIAQYTKLGGGLNHFDSEQQEWIPSQAIIEAFEGGAIARHGQTKVIFSPSLGDPAGTVDILSADGQRFRSVVLGLAYYDPISGNDVIISEVNPNAEGQILPPNQVIYRNAFKDISADVIYEYTEARFSQNIVLREQPPNPELIGFSTHSRLEVISEFLEAPPVKQELRFLRALVENKNQRQLAQEPDLVDEFLNFGSVSIGTGRAFDLGKDDAPENPSAIVVKRWLEHDGRKILFEGVEYRSAKNDLGALEAPQEARLRALAHPLRSGERKIPPSIAARSVVEPREMLVASTLPIEEAGYFIDYEILSSTVSNFTFQSSQTYFVNGEINATGVTTFEGGTTIKYGEGRTGLLVGDVSFKTSHYTPVILTSMHDNTVGEEIQGSTGTPPASPYHYANGLTIGGANNLLIENIRIRYLRYPIWANSSVGAGGHTIRNAVIQDSYLALVSFGSRDIEMQNILIDNAYSAFYTRTYPGGSIDGTVLGTNITMHDVDQPINGAGGLDPDELRNTLIIGPTASSFTGLGEPHNVHLTSATGVFQAAGGGNYYLANKSPYRDSGTNDIDSELAAELGTMTTYPPEIITTGYEVDSDRTWSPIVKRDFDQPDLGYHYAPLDFLVNSMYVKPNATLTITEGTAVGTFGDLAPGEYSGIRLQEDCGFVMAGSWSRPIMFVDQLCVQESDDSGTNPVVPVIALYPNYSYTTHESFDKLILRHVHGSTPRVANPGAVSSAFFGFGVGIWPREIEVTNCKFTNFSIYLFGNSLLKPLEFKGNTIVGNGYITFTTNSDFHCFNNQIRGQGNIYLNLNKWGGAYSVRDNVFQDVGWVQLQDTTVIWNQDWDGSNNVYLDSSGNYLGPNQQWLSGGFDFSSGPFGNYYQPNDPSNPLLNAGSQSGTNAGLYHFTALNDETAELNSTVEIGVHYPVAGSDGSLLDSDGDQIPDLLEDADGDGVVDSGETDWAVSENGTTGVAGLQLFTRLE